MTSHVQLILGGARCGKSRYALHQGDEDSFASHLFFATAHAADEEMRRRIQQHQKERDPRWKTIESPYELTADLEKWALDEKGLVVLDCLTFWISNLLCGMGGKISSFEETQSKIVTFQKSLSRLKGKIRIVSNEVGWGIVPDNVLSRNFRDLQGQMNQSIATLADEVVLMVAGIPLKLKQP